VADAQRTAMLQNEVLEGLDGIGTLHGNALKHLHIHLQGKNQVVA